MCIRLFSGVEIDKFMEFVKCFLNGISFGTPKLADLTNSQNLSTSCHFGAEYACESVFGE